MIRRKIKINFILLLVLILFSNIVLGDNNEERSYILAKESIKQKAIDVAKQIEIYIKLNPKKTIEDLQFQF